MGWRTGGLVDWWTGHRYNDVLGTVLHELVHIEIGPHNAKFYKMLDELWEGDFY